MEKQLRIIISGGGTGGHIFPAVSIANAIKAKHPEADILFVGALGRMEMQRVPAAGYRIIGLPVRGFIRPLWSPKNIGVALDFLKSKRMVKKTIKEFNPQVAVGVGGYASGATLDAASSMGIPCLIQEQNSYAGVTNKHLAHKAEKICVAYDGMERFFPKDKIILTGNPVRQNLTQGSKEAALKYFEKEFGVQFDPEKPVLLVIGGSLGARTINEAMQQGLNNLICSGIQVIWQTGKAYYDNIVKTTPATTEVYVITPFLSNMPDTYALADLVVSRAGASSISELCLLGKPSVLVPSPNVAEDHQTHNAMALVKHDAAVLVRDVEAKDKLIPTVLNLIEDPKKLSSLHTNVLALAQTDSANRIAEEVIRLAKSRKQ